MVIYCDIICLNNKITWWLMNLKVYMKINYFNQNFNIHVERKKNWNPPKFDYDMNLIWPTLGHSKVHNFFLLRFL